MEPLSRQEFAAALKKGQGRALQHIIQFGMCDYKDLVLDACIHNKNYDFQVDSSRADWLFSMFRNTPYYEEFRDAILNSIDNSETKDLFAMGSLLHEMAVAGDAKAKQKLKEIAFDFGSNGWEDEDIIEKWTDLQNFDEFLALARILGSRLMKDPEASPSLWLIPEDRKQEFKEILFQSAKSDPAIQKYLDYYEQQEKRFIPKEDVDRDAENRARHERIRQKYSLNQILDEASKKKGNLPGRYMTFGQHATKEELNEINTALLKETDPEVQMRLLWVFRRTQLPILNDLLFQWARGSHEGLRGAVIAALGQIQDEEVHRLAKEKAKSAEILGPDSETIALFHRNYEEGDAALIASALKSVHEDEEDAHELGFDLIELSEIQEDPHLVDALKWVYEHTPCTLCRENAVHELKKYNGIDDQMRQELPYDANEDIREMLENNKNDEGSENPS